MTQKMARLFVCLLWTIPFVVILALFSSMNDQGFQSKNCERHDFLSSYSFRVIFSCLILIPTLLIMIIYALFHSILWGKRDIRQSAISKQNIKAAKTTLMILFTCTAGWLPAVTCHLLICEDNCKFKYQDFSITKILLMHSVSYILMVLKSFSNPLIFAIRQKNIRNALKSLFYCIKHCKKQPRNDQHLKYCNSYFSLKMKNMTKDTQLLP